MNHDDLLAAILATPLPADPEAIARYEAWLDEQLEHEINRSIDRYLATNHQGDPQ